MMNGRTLIAIIQTPGTLSIGTVAVTGLVQSRRQLMTPWLGMIDVSNIHHTLKVSYALYHIAWLAPTAEYRAIRL